MPSAPAHGAVVRLLLIDQCRSGLRMTREALAGHWGEGVETVACADVAAAAQVLRTTPIDVVLADCETLALAGGLEAGFSRLAALAGGALILALSDGTSVSVAVEAMRSGAHDTLVRPVSGAMLACRLEELGRRHGKARAISPVAAAPRPSDFEGFVGNSAQMCEIYDQIVRVAPSSAPVFITGESGTGKEVTAEALHRRSPRSGRPFIAVNAGAIPGELMESELFGAVRGAYTGAHQDRKGAVELADGGTLFLDEIGEMDLGLQAKLLRFLQTGTISRVGDATPVPVDVRVICATNRNPMQLVAERRFREDLFYRLHVLPIHLPPLRQRPGDILPLAESFLDRFSAEENKRFSGFSPEAADLFVGREWPGNVRQLQNLVRRIVVMFDGGPVSVAMVTAADVEARGEPMRAATRREPLAIQPMWQQEQRIIEEALDAFGGNIARAAAALEISPSTIYRKRLSWEREGKVAGAA